MAKLERIYTIPLGDAYEASRNRRGPKAIKLLREFIGRHMKAKDILLSNALNGYIWERSIQKPPRRVKVRLIKEDETVRAYLADEKIEEPKKEAKKEAKPEEKKEGEKAPESKESPKEEKPSAKAEAKKEPEKKPEAKAEKKEEKKAEPKKDTEKK